MADTRKSKFTVNGSELIEAIKKLIHEGNIRRIRLLQDDKPLIDIPLTVGVITVLAAPVLAAIGVIAALVSECTIEVEKVGDKTSGDKKPEDTSS
ncbi:MAG: DUF4342 domain-containing protein [Candidatus Aminicenantales bacterium]